MTVRLVIFDVDGTLVDSQAEILAAMAAAFGTEGLACPDRAAVLNIVGLSLDQAMAVLVPDLPEARRTALVTAYKASYNAARLIHGAAHSPLYPGARAVLDLLRAAPDMALGVATGKSRRGLDGLFAAHGLDPYFVTRQVADDHPSKPHPAMIRAALADTGVAPGDAVMVGDTVFDMDMARAAGVRGIGVTWGYHAADALRARTDTVIDDFAALPAALGIAPGILTGTGA